MFTGLVEALGKVQMLRRSDNACRLTIDCGQLSDGLAIGASVAINGCCLTAVALAGQLVDFEAGSETLSRTNLGNLGVGDPVNLERALAVGDRMGGHYVSGHVDGLGTLLRREDDPPWAKLWFSVPTTLTQQMASKGSVTVDGVSLTLVDVDDDAFSVALIPHTLQVTTLGIRHPGGQVNVETDILAKYVTRFLETQDRWQSDKQQPI